MLSLLLRNQARLVATYPQHTELLLEIAQSSQEGIKRYLLALHHLREDPEIHWADAVYAEAYTPTQHIKMQARRLCECWHEFQTKQPLVELSLFIFFVFIFKVLSKLGYTRFPFATNMECNCPTSKN